VSLDARSSVLVAGRKPGLPEMRGFNDMVVNADNLRQFGTALNPSGHSVRPPANLTLCHIITRAISVLVRVIAFEVAHTHSEPVII
jgi:hypothetical protein